MQSLFATSYYWRYCFCPGFKILFLRSQYNTDVLFYSSGAVLQTNLYLSRYIVTSLEGFRSKPSEFYNIALAAGTSWMLVYLQWQTRTIFKQFSDTTNFFLALTLTRYQATLAPVDLLPATKLSQAYLWLGIEQRALANK